MSNFWIIFCIIYFGVLGMFWLIVLIDEGDMVKECFGKERYYGKLTIEEWVTVLWVSLLWPFYVIYLFFKNNIALVIAKAIWSAIKFIFKFITYPFKLLFNGIKIKRKEREPFKDKLGKFIVKVFKL